MGRAARVRMKGVWYHVTNRGIDRESIFKTESDHLKFLEFLGKLPERYGFKIHGYVLMGNHYHLLVEDPEQRISEGIKWLNLCYGMSFNRRHRRIGPVFQGRFKGVILDPEDRGLSVSCYVHLNPVRVKSLGLDKREAKAIRAGKQSGKERVDARLNTLHEYPWSSYRAYVGLERSADWLTTEFVLKKSGGKKGYRQQVEKEIREGKDESPWGELIGGLVLGSGEFVGRIRKRIQGDCKEQKAMRILTRGGRCWEEIVSVVESIKGERTEDFWKRHGDWGRDLIWLLCREMGRLKLREIGEKSGVEYGVVAAGIFHCRRKMEKSDELQKSYKKARGRLICNI